MPSRLLAAAVLLAALVAALPAAAHAQDARALLQRVEALQGRISGSPAAVHKAKRELVAAHFADAERSGVSYADVFLALDCVSTAIQKARNAPGRASSQARAARACLQALVRKLAASGASRGVRAEATRLAKALAAIAARVKARRAFGAKATALRKAASAFVGRHFNGRPVGDLSFRAVYDDLECVDVKVETGARAGALACAKRLARLLRERLPDKPAVTFGSDLARDPVGLPGKFPEDSGFWTSALEVPADGLITRFRLKVGSQPVPVTVRFSVVRPEPDGRVRVVTTTDPRLQVAARAPRTYTVDTTSLSFRCCRVQRGDLVAVTSSGADQAETPFHWFAEAPGSTTFVHENPVPGSRDQNPGVAWSFTRRENLETLLQVVMTPS